MSGLEPANSSANLAAGEAQRRLHWRCRRGMLELDLLLQGFLDGGYARLDERRRAGFVELLEYPDQMLLEYLLGRMEPVDPVIADVVAEIRRSAHS